MYIKTDNSIIRDDGTCIPLDTGNADYQIFLIWQQAGNVANTLDLFPTLKASEVAAFIFRREDLIGRLVGIAIAAQAAGAPAIVTAAVAARQSLLDLLTLPSVVNATTLVDLRAAVKQEYSNILAAMPNALRNAFNKLDQ